jgi:hypothetical protein
MSIKSRRRVRLTAVVLGRLLCLCLACIGCASEQTVALECASEAAIFNGSLDSDLPALSDADMSAIGALELADGELVCSATVFSKGWVLTAKHCDTSERLLFRPSSQSVRYEVGRRVLHPTRDAMVMTVQLQESYGRLQPIRPLASEIPPELSGQLLTLAGLGFTESAAEGELRFAPGEVTDINEIELFVDATGSAGACFGDSGGPLLGAVAGEVRIFGVLSRGATNCVGVDAYVRVDSIVDWLGSVHSERDDCHG